MHQKKYLKITLVFIIFLLMTISLAPAIKSDGGGFYYSQTMNQWLAMKQEKQIGIINFNNDYEKLIIVIDVVDSNLQGEKIVWIFPIPASPEDVTIDILDKTPMFRGRDLHDLSDDVINDNCRLMYLSQPHLVPPVLTYFYSSGMLGISGIDTGYNVYESVEKQGMTTEIIDAEDSVTFQSYLDSHDLTFSDKANDLINEYIGQEYCFVVSWISDVEEFRNNAIDPNDYYINPYDVYYAYYDEPFYVLGVSIDFPTEKIYYPLKLTSVYGEETIPILVQVVDFVTPSEMLYISKYGSITTNYYVMDDYYLVPTNLTTFFGEQIQQLGEKWAWLGKGYSYEIPELKYTEIEIHSKAMFLTEDLWIEDSAPLAVSASDFIRTSGLIVHLIIFILLSCLCSLLAGFVIYYKNKPSLGKFALFGLTNFTGIVGFLILSFVLKIDEKFLKMPVEKKPKKDCQVHMILLLIIATIFAIITVIFMFLSSDNVLLGIIYSILIFGPTLLVIAMFIYCGYKDIKKTKFALLFSLFFIICLAVTQVILTTLT